MGILLDLFPEQPLDFFGSLRSAVYDDQIRDWIQEDVLKTRSLMKMLIWQKSGAVLSASESSFTNSSLVTGPEYSCCSGS